MVKIIKDFLNFLITTLLVVLMFDLIVNDPITSFIKISTNKINNSNQIKNIFVGDSSCGNSIDSKLFEVGTYNLSLTGDYNIINHIE